MYFYNPYSYGYAPYYHASYNPQPHLSSFPGVIRTFSFANAICGEKNRSSNNFIVGSPMSAGSYRVGAPSGVEFEIRVDKMGIDKNLGKFSNGRSVSLETNKNYYIASPKASAPFPVTFTPA